MESTLRSFLGGSPDQFAERGVKETATFYTLLNFLNANNREAFVRFMLDPSKSAERLRDLMPPRNATSEEAIRAFSLIVSDVLAEPVVESIYDVPYRAEDQKTLKQAVSRAGLELMTVYYALVGLRSLWRQIQRLIKH